MGQNDAISVVLGPKGGVTDKMSVMDEGVVDGLDRGLTAGATGPIPP